MIGVTPSTAISRGGCSSEGGRVGVAGRLATSTATIALTKDENDERKVKNGKDTEFDYFLDLGGRRAV